MPLSGNQLSYNTESAETDITSWTSLVNSTLAWSAAYALDGTHSVSLTSAAAGACNMINATGVQAFPLVTPGNDYQFFYGIYTVTASLTAAANTDFYNGSSYINTANGTTTPLTQNAWTWVTVTGTAPAGATLARIYPEFLATAAAQVAYVDEVYFGAPASTTAVTSTVGGSYQTFT